MKKEDILLVAQLLSSMKDAVNKLEKAYKRKDLEELNSAKRELLNFQDQINKIL